MNFSTFSNNLRLLIESHGMTAKAFSEEIGIPHATISRYLSENREPKLTYVVQICNFFGVSIDWMVGMGDKKFDALPEDMQNIVSLYAIATEDDRRVIRAVLRKYKKE